MKVVSSNRKDWSLNLPVEIEYKAWWAVKKLNLDMRSSSLKRILGISELEELRNDAYFNSKIAKDRLKKWHDQLIARKNFKQGDQVVLYDSKLYHFPGKLKSRWTGSFIVHQVYLNGSVDLLNFKDNRVFKVNGQRLKPYAVQHTTDKEEIPLLDHPPPPPPRHTHTHTHMNPKGYPVWVWSLQKFLGHPKILLRVC